jgi:hypothetical protein
MAFTKRISIERYKNADELGSAGLIEGETESGERWIIFMDVEGRPSIYWPNREPDGGVIGEGIPLDRGVLGAVFRQLKVESEDELVSTFPIWEEREENPESIWGMRGIVYAVVPGDLTPGQKMAVFLKHLSEGWQLSTPERRLAKMKQILASSDDPAEVVARLQAAVATAEEHDKPIE